MQNTFSQSGNDSKWFLKKSFFKIGMWHSRPPRAPPPFMANAILNFHFDFLNPSLIGNIFLILRNCITQMFHFRDQKSCCRLFSSLASYGLQCSLTNVRNSCRVFGSSLKKCENFVHAVDLIIQYIYKSYKLPYQYKLS